MQFNGCGMLLSIGAGFGAVILIVILALLGPAIGNVFDDVVTELEAPTPVIVTEIPPEPVELTPTPSN